MNNIYTLQGVYEFYDELIKPTYSKIEANNNTLPVELLFEIHAAFDHIKRIYIEKEDEQSCCRKAISHLRRGSYDIFKLELKYFN